MGFSLGYIIGYVLGGFMLGLIPAGIIKLFAKKTKFMTIWVWCSVILVIIAFVFGNLARSVVGS